MDKIHHAKICIATREAASFAYGQAHQPVPQAIVAIIEDGIVTHC